MDEEGREYFGVRDVSGNIDSLSLPRPTARVQRPRGGMAMPWPSAMPRLAIFQAWPHPTPHPAARPVDARGREASSNYRKSRESFLSHAGRLDAAAKKLFGNAKKSLDTSGYPVVKGKQAKGTIRKRKQAKKSFWQCQKKT